MVIAVIREDLITDEALLGTPTMMKYRRMQMQALCIIRPTVIVSICAAEVFKWLNGGAVWRL